MKLCELLAVAMLILSPLLHTAEKVVDVLVSGAIELEQ